MKHKKNFLILSILLLFLTIGSKTNTAPVTAVLYQQEEDFEISSAGTQFTYQGYLTDGGIPANGVYDFVFQLYDSSSGGSRIGDNMYVQDLQVTEGRFSVTLDFGSGAFNGDSRWLRVYVRPGDSTGGYPELTPRQEIRPVPYAITAENVYGNMVGTFGSGIVHGGSSVNQRFLAGSLPKYDTTSNQFEKLMVTVWGGSWENSTLGQDFYSISIRGGVKVSRTRLFGSTSDHALKVYFDNANNQYDVIVEVIGQAWPNLVIRSQMLNSEGGFDEQEIYSGYDVSGKTDVTPEIEAHLISDNDGNFGIGTTNPQAKLDIAGGSILLDANAQIYGYQTSGNRGFIKLYNGDTGDMELGTTFSGGEVVFYSGGIQHMVLTKDGYLGLNEMWPERAFHIRSSVPYVRFEDTDKDSSGFYGNEWEAGVFGQNHDFRISELLSSGSKPRLIIEEGGLVNIGSLKINSGMDVAEPFSVNESSEIVPGMVLVIDSEHPGKLRLSSKAYDRLVAGCVSGANGINPGLILQQDGVDSGVTHPVALSGRVYCWADASFGAIQPGDLLTTSDNPGHMMRVDDYAKALGAILGKAMSPLTEGTGLVLVLVSLQ